MSFEAGGKHYLLRFFGLPTYRVFPNSVLKKGMIYEIVWFPADAQNTEDKYARTGGNSVGDVRTLLRTLKGMVAQKLQQLNPVGFYFKGADADLDRFWKKFTRPEDFPGYTPSSLKPNVYVRADMKNKIDTESYDDDY